MINLQSNLFLTSKLRCLLSCIQRLINRNIWNLWFPILSKEWNEFQIQCRKTLNFLFITFPYFIIKILETAWKLSPGWCHNHSLFSHFWYFHNVKITAYEDINTFIQCLNGWKYNTFRKWDEHIISVITWHFGQHHLPSGISLRGGSRHCRWYTLLQVSQSKSCPDWLHTPQKSSWASCQNRAFLNCLLNCIHNFKCVH